MAPRGSRAVDGRPAHRIKRTKSALREALDMALDLHITCAAGPVGGIQAEENVHGKEKESKKREENRS
jgi:hypothetical protein